MRKKRLPRVLVLANNSLSDNNSNGRTLAGFLRDWDKKDLAQIYITSELPQSTVCERFYRITDNEVLNAVLKRKKNVGGIVQNDFLQKIVKSNTKKRKKNIAAIMARDMLWSTNVWWTDELKKWIADFKPEVLLLFAGESCFTNRMAAKISKHCGVPIVVYNSEAYYFKDKNYLKGSVLSEILYPIFHAGFKRSFKNMMKLVKAEIYINDKLKKAYDSEFYGNSYVIYTSSSVEYREKISTNITFKTAYLGNLGIGREKPLVEIAEALQQIDKSYKLDVYGKIPSEAVQKAFDECEGINYCGLIPYEKVIEVMHESDLLVHGESFDKFTRWDLQYAFTTKIADSLACGTCFMIYAPEGLACVEYLKENDCAFVVTEKDRLKETLKEIIGNSDLRADRAQKARGIAEANHNREASCRRFEEIIVRAAENNEGSAD